MIFNTLDTQSIDKVGKVEVPALRTLDAVASYTEVETACYTMCMQSCA